MHLPEFLQAELATPPISGEGVHNWMYRIARCLHAHMNEEDIFALLQGKLEDCGREVPDRELHEAIRNSKQAVWGKNSSRSDWPKKKWPDANQNRIRKIIAKHGMSQAELSTRSPINTRRKVSSLSTAGILKSLFSPDSLICAGRSNRDFATLPLADWKSKLLSPWQLLVPSPMSALSGRRKSDGVLSPHTLDNTGPRRFLVIEFDRGTLDDQTSLVWELGRCAPLVMVVFSGSKSLHAWFLCQNIPDAELHRFMRFAVFLGADSATWTRSQFVRMPNAVRSNGSVQKVLFFNPTLLK